MTASPPPALTARDAELPRRRARPALFRRADASAAVSPRAPELPPGLRVYAVGDVHGRLDLVREALGRIEADTAARGGPRPIVVFLGDLIDRGPDSAGVVDLLMGRPSWAHLVCLKGNHEAAMLDALAGDLRAARMWFGYGGIEALASWGVPRALLDAGDIEAVLDAALETVPAAHRYWLAELPVSYRVGDYYFVHAGIRPGVPIDRQAAADMLWIRDPFLRSREPHGVFVIHGHSITPTIDERPNRMGIDTGAYATGMLSVVGLEGRRRWILRTGATATGMPA